MFDTHGAWAVVNGRSTNKSEPFQHLADGRESTFLLHSLIQTQPANDLKQVKYFKQAKYQRSYDAPFPVSFSSGEVMVRCGIYEQWSFQPHTDDTKASAALCDACESWKLLG
jgi:hypothetical protein